MARQHRLRLIDRPFHIIQRGVDRERVFERPEDYRLYLGLLGEWAPQVGCDIHGYGLMTNHVHLFVTPRREGACSWLMKHVGHRYAQAANRRWGRSGPMWEGRYKACLVDTGDYELDLQKYIEWNPVRAHMVRHPGEYPWSSYRTSALGAPSTLLTPSEAYLALGSDDVTRRLAYRMRCKDPMTEAMLREIRDAANGDWAWGSAEFLEAVAARVGRRVARRNAVAA